MNAKKIFRIIIIATIVIGFVNTTKSQIHYWVFFTDKNGVEFNPFEYFDQKAIDRRISLALTLSDSTDFPINPHYKKSVEQIATTITSETRWFNAVAITADHIQLEQIQRLPFVKKIVPITLQTYPAVYDIDLDEFEDDLLAGQLNRMQGNLFIQNGFDGTGIRIAVFDAGFPTVNYSPVFEHLVKGKKIIATYDFARKKENVYAHNQHGTMVLSCIAGMVENKHLGLATGAEFLLARTEIDTEPFSEEENWLAAVEWADKNGADIINSSLGYTYHRYFTFEMDGHTSLVVKAANLAASKGILVLNAMGNDGDNDWKILGTPADADSIISVGGISPTSDYKISFSSFGPTADNRTKPNVVAFGEAIVASKNKLKKSQGTSFSTPLVTGFAACAWQKNKELTNMQIKREIEKSGHLYPYYDYAHGFGVPQASYFLKTDSFEIPTKKFETVRENNNLYIRIDNKFITKKSPKQNNYLYFHVRNQNGKILKYWLVDVYQNEAAVINLDDWDPNDEVVIHYKGYTEFYNIKNQ